MIRQLRGNGINGEYIWEAREMSNPDDSHFWLATGYKDAGFLQYTHMADIISIMLQRYPETNNIHTSWGNSVYIEKLIPDALATLAVKALAK